MRFRDTFLAWLTPWLVMIGVLLALLVWLEIDNRRYKFRCEAAGGTWFAHDWICMKGEPVPLR